MMTEPAPDVRHPVGGQAPTPSWAGPYRTVEGRDEVLVPCDTCGGPVYESCRTRWRDRGQLDCGIGCEPRLPVEPVELCSCGKPAIHLELHEDDREWACLVPNFDPSTGLPLPPVGRYAPRPAPAQPARRHVTAERLDPDLSGRGDRRPLQLTRRGRRVRGLVVGVVGLVVAVMAQSVSVAFFTVVVWASQLAGLSS